MLLGFVAGAIIGVAVGVVAVVTGAIVEVVIELLGFGVWVVDVSLLDKCVSDLSFIIEYDFVAWSRGMISLLGLEYDFVVWSRV
ncbi:16007_t:CDS:2 [Dentiscutata erythropus]|uniref:16007_t:CDS:1 n=1 Tax=Dentiscutata erythropus TaxID=1348616 RepID=A0A9N9ECB4_9GLOM|nr:16007_t:CDS:2 [Dentiscutata erythropus]